MRRTLLAIFGLALMPIPGQAAGFSDIRASDPDAAAIAYVQERGIMTGVNGRFEPDRPVTRAELAKIAVKANGIATTEIASAPFPDVPRTHSLAPYVAALKGQNEQQVKNGNGMVTVLNGNPDGMFHPWREASLPEAAKILLGAARIRPLSGRDFFGLRSDHLDWQATYGYGVEHFYALAAQQDLFDRPLLWYDDQSRSSALRRDVARALSSMGRWKALATRDDPAVCKPGAEWDPIVREGALWSPGETDAQYSEICVIQELGIGFNVFNRASPLGGTAYAQLYVFRADDWLAEPMARPVGSVHSAMLLGERCSIVEVRGVHATFSCGPASGESEGVARVSRYNFAIRQSPFP